MPTMMDVPEHFQRNWTSAYNYDKRCHQHGAWFENFAANRGLKVGDDWVYVPIIWSALSPSTGYAAGVKWLESKMDKDTRYFTLLMAAEGIDAIKPAGLTVVGGSTGDICMPLVSQRNVGLADSPFMRPSLRKYRSNFMGCSQIPHNAFGVRPRMLAKLPKDTYRRVKTHRKHKLPSFPAYMSVMRDSVYTFAPRGFGPSSFRLYEAMAVGSIPIYIWKDRLQLPFTDQVDWDELAVVQEADWDGAFPERNAKLGREFHREFCEPEQLCQKIERLFQ